MKKPDLIFQKKKIESTSYFLLFDLWASNWKQIQQKYDKNVADRIRNDGLAPINLAKLFGLYWSNDGTIIFGSNITNTTINTPFSFSVESTSTYTHT